MAVDDERMVLPLGLEVDEGAWIAEGEADARRRYVTSLVRRRLHQRWFRERVLRAYRQQCSFCRLRHAGLQGLHGQRIQRPRSPELRPDPGLLAARWERFTSAAAGS